MRKKILLSCVICDSEYLKDESEHKRNIKLNRKSYCSRRCQGKGLVINLSITPLNKLYDDKNEMMFHTYIKAIQKRNKETNLTTKDLLEQWNLQEGKCPYTNIRLIIVDSRNVSPTKKDNYYMYASLDRIDSSLGYVKGNIEFVSLPINYMKHIFSKEKTIEFLNLIKTIR